MGGAAAIPDTVLPWNQRRHRLLRRLPLELDSSVEETKLIAHHHMPRLRQNPHSNPKHHLLDCLKRSSMRSWAITLHIDRAHL